MSNDASNSPALLDVRELTTEFATPQGRSKVVDRVTFSVGRGELAAIVGESGSGKTMLGLSLIRLVPDPGRMTGGSVRLNGVDISALSDAEFRRLRGSRIAMVFQDPATSLNPYLTIGEQLCELTRLHLGLSKTEARRAAIEMLSVVGIADASERIDQYPHEFSGGMRQRVMIAAALSCEPDLIIADEPTTALDATIQAQIIDLLIQQQRRTDTAVILITHDLEMVMEIADSVIVMYGGRVFERASAAQLIAGAANPYTIALLKCLSQSSPAGDLYQIPGRPPDLAAEIAACAFAERCERAEDICHTSEPELVEISDGHFSRCHFAIK